MTTATLPPRETPRAYSVTPKGKPHIRVLHIPYHYSQLAPTIEVFKLPAGCQMIDWALRLNSGDAEWIFVVDTSKEQVDDESEHEHVSDFDFRGMMRQSI